MADDVPSTHRAIDCVPLPICGHVDAHARALWVRVWNGCPVGEVVLGIRRWRKGGAIGCVVVGGGFDPSPCAVGILAADPCATLQIQLLVCILGG